MEGVHAVCAERFGRLEERVEDCEDYQAKNNGAVVRMANDVTAMKDSINRKFNVLYMLLISNLVGLVVFLVR